MTPFTAEPVVLMYRGLKLFFEQRDFEFLRESRESATQSWLNCSCYFDPKMRASYRCSFFGQQQPTVLVPNGELDPTEIRHHLPAHVVDEISFLLNDFDPFNHDKWRSKDGGQIIRNYNV